MVKKIHYCWFGGEKPEAVKRNVEAWGRLNPDFEIKEWNESNTDVSAWEFGRRAWRERKWGFLVDIIRPLKLYEEGGFYLDADVELVRSLSALDTGSNGEKLLMGYMYGCALGTAVLYAPPGHPYVLDILRSYNYILPDKWPVSNSIFTAYFINKVPGFLLNGRPWENELCRLYSKEFFEQPAFFRRGGMSIHHCCGSWKKAFAGEFGFESKRYFAHLLKWASRKYRVWRATRSNEFTPCWRAAGRGETLAFDITAYYTTSQPYAD